MSRVYSRLCGGGKSVLLRTGMPMGGGLKQHFLPLGKDPIRLEAPAVGLGGRGPTVPQGRVNHQQSTGPGNIVDIIRRNAPATGAVMHTVSLPTRASERKTRKPRSHLLKSEKS